MLQGDWGARRVMAEQMKVADARPLQRVVMRCFAFCWRSRDRTLAVEAICRPGGKERLLPQRFGIVDQKPLFHPDRGTRRRSDPVSFQQSIGPLQTTLQSLRILYFRSWF